jgi:hypothetical protein
MVPGEPEDCVQTLFNDLQYTLRQLLKSPGFTITAVLTWRSVSASTPRASAFSIMDAVVLGPLAVPELNRVVPVSEQQNRGNFQSA